MPIQRCGKKGWQFGNAGKCYKGAGAKKKAINQGLAIQRSQKARGQKVEKL
jgi:hypothetical protein